MRIFRHYTELPVELRGGVVALGNFDGVHLGHQAVISTAQRAAAQSGLPCGVLTFEPHPRQVFQPDAEPFRLTPMRIKAHHIEQLGADFLILQHFDLDFASHTAESFVQEVLIRHLDARQVVVGYDYAFGTGRKGDTQALAEMGAQHGFGVICVDAAVDAAGEVYSSTRARRSLEEGRPRDAAAVLGAPWEIEARVEHGDARGRTIGFPTANLKLGEYLRPAFGVYAVLAGVDAGAQTQWHPGVANLGRRPTFGKLEASLEVNLFDFDGDLYGKHLRVQMIDFLRPERKFDGLEALTTQIRLDAIEARRLFAANPLTSETSTTPSLPSLD